MIKLTTTRQASDYQLGLKQSLQELEALKLLF